MIVICREAYIVPTAMCLNTAYMGPKKVTKDGFDMTFTVNYLSHFLLTKSLLEAIPPSVDNPLRIINVASDAYRKGMVDFNDIMQEKNPKAYDMYQTYANSKLALLLFTFELHYRYTDGSLVPLSVHPGMYIHIWF